ncbi:MAG: coenzyme F420-0:L-glutamate ligase [Tissierellia bacterium]|nr:coenzyme F420-0:L-glutamate ligase [Tissierellia bacterium]
MNRFVGTTVRGIRTPIIKQGDDLVPIVTDSLMKAAEYNNIEFRDRDVIAVTESLVARAQGNYVTTEDIAKDIADKFPDEIGIVFPILSRNRFSIILKGIAESKRKIHILLSYPADEVGNHLIAPEALYQSDVNPYSDVLDEEEFRKTFGDLKHPFTQVDYVALYREICGDTPVEIHFANDPRAILNYTKDVLVAEVHTRNRTKKILEDTGVNKIYTLDDICTKPGKTGGYNPEYGLLGSNLAGKSMVKLFPRDSQKFVEILQEKLVEITKKNIEVMVYGDGAFKDPAGKIWELADPVVSPGHTKGLIGTPNEIKIKYIADNELAGMSGEEAIQKMKEKINEKSEDLSDSDEALGTTPRNLTDLLGSLSDLTSGSGDKGTPVVWIQGYFDSYASE